MAETTLQTMDQSLAETLGDFDSLATTAAGAATGKTVVSQALLDLPGGTDEDAFENFYLRIADSTSGANEEVRRVVSYVENSDAPTLLFARAFSVQIDSGVTVQLTRFNPVDRRNQIRRAIRELFPDLYLHIRDESLIVDDILVDSGMENWTSGVLDSWTVVGSPTVTQETSRVRHGASSAKVVASGAAGQLTQTPTVNVNEITTNTVRAKKWVYATSAGAARIRVDYGASFANSVYHSGQDQWELLTIDSSVPKVATQVKMICEVADGFTGYFDTGYFSVGPLSRYVLPSAMLRGPNYLYQQYDENETEGSYYPMRDASAPTEGRILRLRGMGILSQPTTDSGTTEVGEPQTQLIVAYAKMLFYRLMATPARSAQQNRQGYIDAALDAAGEVAILKGQIGIVMPSLGAQRHRDSWRVEQDGTQRLLIFDQVRA